MVTITRTETEDGVSMLTVRAKTGPEAVAAFQAIKALDAEIAAGVAVQKVVQEAGNGHART